jgi:thiol-disulfide isomerase/thioredoxin
MHILKNTMTINTHAMAVVVTSFYHAPPPLCPPCIALLTTMPPLAEQTPGHYYLGMHLKSVRRTPDGQTSLEKKCLPNQSAEWT